MKSTHIRNFFLWIWEIASAVSVRAKIFGMALGLILVLGVVVVWQVRISISDLLQNQLQNESINAARDLAARAADPILLNDLVAQQRLLLDTLENNPDVHYAFILDKDGQVLAHTFGSGFPIDLLAVNSVKTTEHHKTIILETNDGLVWDTAVPVLEGRAGFVRLGISDVRMRQALQAVTRQMLLVITLVSAVGVLFATFLTLLLTRPVLQLVDATHKIAHGDFSPRVPRWADDEIGELAVAFNQMAAELSRTDELRQEREQLRKQLLESVITTQEEERRRISRELHDGTSQSLTSLIVGLQMLETSADSVEVASQAHHLRETARQTLGEIHTLAIQLRPTVLDDMGLLSAMQIYASEYQGTYGIQIEIQAVGLEGRRLTPALETAIYRIAQEALTNVAKYAHAHQVSILLEQQNQIFSLIIEDDGEGFDANNVMRHASRNKQLGLYGMQERITQLGGQFLIESEPGKGTTLYMRVPMEKQI